MSRCLFIGDAVASTGFERCTRAACLGLQRAGWEVHVLGINYDGDPHGYPWPTYPAARSYRINEDAFGVHRSGELVERLKPDLVVILQDPWNVPAYVDRIRAVDPDVPIAGWIAVDGENCLGTSLQGLAHAVFWTRFGAEQARLGGYGGTMAVVPLGVDLKTYWSRSRDEARRWFGIVDERREHFIVGAVGRNQPRKRLDLTIAYFAEWMHSRKVEDAQLLLHVAPTRDAGWDLPQLGKHYGLIGHLMVSTPDFYHGLAEEDLALVYATFDAQISTTQGEGFGLCQLEGMACGVPQILPDWSALGEWALDAALMVPCTEREHTPRINAVGGRMDRQGAVEAIDALYRDKALRADFARRGLALARRPQHRWQAVGDAFASEMERFCPVDASAVEGVPEREAVA